MPVYKDKANNTWFYQFQLKGKTYKKRGFTSKSEATQKEIEKIDELKMGIEQSPRECLISSIINLYLEKASLENRQSTNYKDNITFNLHITPYFGNLKAFELTNAKLIKWKKEIILKGFSESRTNQIISKMKLLVQFGIINNGMNSSLLNELNQITKDEKNKEMLFWTKDEFNKFIDTFDDDSPKKIFFLNLFYSGMRLGEIIALTPNDIKDNVYTVDKQLALNNKRTSPKTKLGYRDIEMPLWIVDITNEYIKANSIKPDQYIFDDGFSRTNIEKIKNIHCKLANVKQIRIHDFRHSCCSMLIQAYIDSNRTIDFLYIAKRMGHSVKETQETYAHMYPKKDIDIISLL